MQPDQVERGLLDAGLVAESGEPLDARLFAGTM